MRPDSQRRPSVAKLETVMKGAIARGARRQVRVLVLPLRREVIRSRRNRLGRRQRALARLVGVSAAAVGHWEAGASTPTGQNRATVVALRKVGKREVKGLLATRLKETTPRASRARTRRRAR